MQHIDIHGNKKLSKLLRGEILDAIEYMEDGVLPSQDEINIHGSFDSYADGTLVFRWKGKEMIVIFPIKPGALHGTFKIPLKRTYLEERYNG